MSQFDQIFTFFDEIMKTLTNSSSSDTKIHILIKQAYHYSLTKGILFLSKKFDNMLEPIGITLLPIPITSNLYNHGKNLTRCYNIMYEKVAADYNFLSQTLKNVISHDPFIGRLWKIYEEARTSGHKQEIKLSINRNDFMISADGEHFQLKQVELNTIAVGMASLSQSTADVHKFVVKQLNLSPNAIPKEEISSRLADAFVIAYNLYRQQNCITLTPMIAIVVNDFESNICDQAILEVDILSKIDSDCSVRRLTLDYIGKNAKIDAEGTLVLNDEFEIVMVYYRTAYSPLLMSSELHWTGRRLVELSRCIKCPSLSYQLSGCKKVQQALGSLEALNKFVKEKDELEMLLSSVVGQYSLDCNLLGDQIAQNAVENPKDFVMKPQREGGGNNFFGDDLVSRLTELQNNPERAQYILMDKIKSKPSKNVLLSTNNNPEVIEVLSEISFYGFVVSKGEEIVHNYISGSFVRLKYSDCNEGGIVIRMSFFSSLYLTDLK